MITRKRVGGSLSTLVDKAVRLWWAGAICLVLAVASILLVCYHAMPLWAAAPEEDDELAANAKALEEYDWIVYWKTNDRPAESPNEAITPDTHPNSSPDNPDGSGNSGPMKIFPCKITYDDQYAPLRRYVLAVAEYKLGESPPAEMYFRLWDVDDPSADGPPIDTRPKVEPGTKGPDNWVPNEDDPVDQHKIASESDATKHFTVAVPRGYVIRFKEDGSWEQKAIEGDNAERLYMVEVKVGMHPGDNYRFTASPELLNLLEPKYKQENADAAQLPDNGRISKKLTVWRKLHVEVDSMDEIAGNTLTGTIQAAPEISGGMAWLTVENLPGIEGVWEEDDHFVPGRIRVAGYNDNNWYDVTDFVSVPFGKERVQVANDPTLEGCKGAAYWLEDDDHLPISGFPPIELPQCLSREYSLDTAFCGAYIDAKIYREAPEYDSNTPFILNTNENSLSDSYWKSAATANKDLSSSAPFWHVHVTAAFQHDKPRDADPDDPEGTGVAGISGVLSGALLFLEVERESFGGIAEAELFVGYNISHEVGHLFGLDHPDGSPGTIMAPFNATQTELCFSELSISKLRDKDYPMH